MPELNVLLAAVICGGIGASVLLLVVAVRGTVLDPTRPPNRLEALLERPRSPLLMLRLAAGVLLAMLIFVVTRWPVAAVGLGGLVAFWPALMGGSKDEQQQIVRLEAVVTWCEALRDTTTGARRSGAGDPGDGRERGTRDPAGSAAPDRPAAVEGSAGSSAAGSRRAAEPLGRPDHRGAADERPRAR